MFLFTSKPFNLPNSSIIVEKEPFNQLRDTVSEKIGQLAYAILLPLKLVFDSTESTLSLLKKINWNILPLIESLKNLPLVKVLESSISLMTGIQIAAHIDYITNSKYIKDSIQTIAGKAALCLSQTIETILWMIKTAGNTHLFAMISRFRVNLVINGPLAISHFLFLLDTFCRFIQTEKDILKNHLKIELAKHGAECSLAMAMMGGVFSAQSVSLLAIVCIGLELTRLVHKEQNVNDL